MDFIQIDSDERECEIFRNKYDKMIVEPYEHLGSIAGKNIREKFGDLYNFWFNITNDEKQIVHNIVSKLHNVSLIIDDIQDNSYLRRGVPAAHIIYGTARTFISANAAVLAFSSEVPNYLRPTVGSAITVASVRALRGQIMDTYWRDNFICPTEEQYVDMICKKTGSIVQLYTSIFKEISNKKDKDFTNLSNSITTHFQILDDYCNLKSPVYFALKGFCEDLTEGKYSYPIICALQNHPEDRRIVEILKMRTTDDTIKAECVELIEKYGGFKDSKNKLAKLRAEISNEIDKLGGQPVKDQFMKLLFAQYTEDF